VRECLFDHFLMPGCRMFLLAGRVFLGIALRQNLYHGSRTFAGAIGVETRTSPTSDIGTSRTPILAWPSPFAAAQNRNKRYESRLESHLQVLSDTKRKSARTRKIDEDSVTTKLSAYIEQGTPHIYPAGVT